MEAPQVRLRPQGAPPPPKKGALIRQLKGLWELFGELLVVLVLDETILRLFPPLRASWSRVGQQALVPISGENDKRVLWGVLNLHTGHRVVQISRGAFQSSFWKLLRELRRRYPGRPIALLLDKAGAHFAPKSQELALDLSIWLLWLPKQTPELNPMDQLWNEMDKQVSANWQYRRVELHAKAAAKWVLDLKPREALRKAGVLAEGFWLQKQFRNFWPPT